MSQPYDNGSDDTYPEDVEDRNDDSARYEAILDDDLPDYEASKKIEVQYEEGEGLENLVKVNGHWVYCPF